MDRRAFVASIPLLGATLSSIAHAAPNGPAPTGRAAQPLMVGQPPPPLHLTRLSGSDEVTLEGLAGRVVVLDFWATWCRPCRAIMPLLDSMYTRYNSQGLSIVGLSPETEGDIRAHMQRTPVRYTIARDVGGTIQAYGVRGIPMLVAIDRTGKVREVMVGVDGPAIQRLDNLVQRMLAETT